MAVGGALGTEFAGPSSRTAFYATVGVSVDFDLPAFGKAR
jgi:hypothetical protein